MAVDVGLRYANPTYDLYDLHEQVVRQRDQSVQRLAGKWALDDCASAVQFVVNGRTLRIAWPQVGDFEERVLNADQREVVSVVVSAGKYQEGLSGYAPTAGAGR